MDKLLMAMPNGHAVFGGDADQFRKSILHKDSSGDLHAWKLKTSM